MQEICVYTGRFVAPALMFKLARWMGSAFVTMVGLYVFFFIPIGRRTLCDHARRVATTPEAREFGDEMRQAGGRVADRTRSEFEGVIRHGVLPNDAGAREAPAPEPDSPPPPHLLRDVALDAGAAVLGAAREGRDDLRALRRASRALRR
ncbi:MAG: hypothetical protein Q8Q09_26705 [Deltaproteobacteria bacterium]|nr:hypothetical protein [Deltaproteobacteria bacterium]